MSEPAEPTKARTDLSARLNDFVGALTIADLRERLAELERERKTILMLMRHLRRIERKAE